MLTLKAMEVRSGKPSILARISDRIDHILHFIYDKAKAAVLHVNRHTFIGLMQITAFHILSALRSSYIWLYKLAHKNPHAKMVIDMVRGRGERGQIGENLKPGAASFFLKRISEDKIVTPSARMAAASKN